MADTEEKLGLAHLIPSTVLTIIMVIKGSIGTTPVPRWMFPAQWAIACVPFFLGYVLRRANLGIRISGLDDPRLRFFMISAIESGYFLVILADGTGMGKPDGSSLPYFQAAFLIGFFALTAVHIWVHKKL